MPFEVQIVPSAREELKAIKVFYRRQIADAIEQQLIHEPTIETGHRKKLIEVEPSFEHEPPLWELRVGEFRVFYDVNESDSVVVVRAVREKPPHATTEEVL
jgi:mRNA-degrading endonuclease RelE of RelBE toxin-antitoxin system